MSRSVSSEESPNTLRDVDLFKQFKTSKVASSLKLRWDSQIFWMLLQRCLQAPALLQLARSVGEIVDRDGLSSLSQKQLPNLKEVEGRFQGLRGRFWPVLRACASHGDPYRVQAWLDRYGSQGLQIDSRIANSLIHAYAKVGDLSAAEKSLLQMIRNGVPPTTESFNAILAACARKEDMSSALKWFQRMQEAQMVPDVVTYRTLISTCARAGNLPLAEEWLEKMLRATERRLDVISCSSIIGGYASQGDVRNAEKWLDRMLLSGLRPGDYAFNPVICVWSYSDPSKSEAWLWKAIEAQSKPSEAALQRTLAAYVQAQNWEGCVRMKELLKHLKLWPSCWASALLAKPHAAAGDYEVVEELLQELPHPDASCLKVLLAAYARAARPVQDERVELCCERLFKLTASKSLHDASLGDARRALGKERYEQVAKRLGLKKEPLIHRKAHARNRVVGSWGEIAPAWDKESQVDPGTRGSLWKRLILRRNSLLIPFALSCWLVCVRHSKALTWETSFAWIGFGVGHLNRMFFTTYLFWAVAIVTAECHKNLSSFSHHDLGAEGGPLGAGSWCRKTVFTREFVRLPICKLFANASLFQCVSSTWAEILHPSNARAKRWQDRVTSASAATLRGQRWQPWGKEAVSGDPTSCSKMPEFIIYDKLVHIV